MQASSAPAKKPRGNPNWQRGGSSPNPKGRGAPAARTDAAVKVDGWINALTGFGVQGRDKRLGAGGGSALGFTADLVSDAEATQLWVGDDIAARIITDLPSEAMRQGIEIELDDKEEAEAIAHRLQDTNALAKFEMALKFRRAYGGAAILPMINDGALLLSTPLNENRISKISAIHVFEPRELQPMAYYSDPMHPKFRRPSLWRLTPSSPMGQLPDTVIHDSRLIVFRGIQTNEDGLGTPRQGWDHNILTRVYSVLRDWNMAWSATGALVQDFTTVIWKIRDLAEMIGADDGRFMARIQGAELARSVMRALVLDTENESWERQSVNINGLPDLLDRFGTRLAAAADMPMTRLLGMSPGGMNATGESDTRGWYDAVKREQKLAQPELVALIRLFLLEIDGATGGKLPDTWTVSWCPLWQPSEKETADTRKTQMDTAIAAVTAQIITPEEARKSMFGGDKYSPDIKLDPANDEQPAAISAEESASLRTPGGTTAAPVASLEPAKQAFTGVQVTALIDVVKAVGAKEISRESGQAILELAFPIDAAGALRVLGPVNFEPVKPEPPASPFGGGPPKPPGAPAPDGDPKPPAPPIDDEAKAA